VVGVAGGTVIFTQKVPRPDEPTPKTLPEDERS
jgi:hypothetical protein